MKDRSLGALYATQSNCLNALRLVLASLVIVSHSWPTGGYGEDPGLGDQNLGAWAVAGFFVISGYLITESRMRSRSFVDYMWRRALRIYPAFLTALTLTAFFFAPISVYVLNAGSYDPVEALGYILKNLGLLVTQDGIPGTLEDSPFPTNWNSPLWTLFYEFLCYLGVGILVSLLPRRFLPAALSIVFIACTLITGVVVFADYEVQFHLLRLARLGGFFAAGALLYMHRERVPVTKPLTVLAAVGVAALIVTSTFQVFAGLPMAYLMLALGQYLPLQKVGSKRDISYGMYIYAFPIQQILALVFGEELPPVVVFVALSVLLTVPFAWASFVLVERPTLRHKRLFAGRDTKVPADAV